MEYVLENKKQMHDAVFLKCVLLTSGTLCISNDILKCFQGFFEARKKRERERETKLQTNVYLKNFLRIY